MKTAVLFAGQGSQAIGMGRDLYQEYDEFREVFDLLPRRQIEIAWEGPENTLRDTGNTQPIMFAFGLGVYQILEKAGFHPDMGAGLSLGEYTALAAARVFTPEEGIRLVNFRAAKMKEAAAGVDPEMIAVMGLDEASVQTCCQDVSTSAHRAEITNLNCPGQVIVSGDIAAVGKAAELALRRGAKRCMKLSVGGPFHTSYMEPASEALKVKLREVNFRKPAFAILYNYIGKEKAPEDSIQELLVKQVSHGVKMESILRNMLDAGVERFIEIGPGRTLAGFLRKIDRSAECVSISTCADVEAVLDMLRADI